MQNAECRNKTSLETASVDGWALSAF